MYIYICEWRICFCLSERYDTSWADRKIIRNSGGKRDSLVCFRVQRGQNNRFPLNIRRKKLHYNTTTTTTTEITVFVMNQNHNQVLSRKIFGRASISRRSRQAEIAEMSFISLEKQRGSVSQLATQHRPAKSWVNQVGPKCPVTPRAKSQARLSLQNIPVHIIALIIISPFLRNR